LVRLGGKESSSSCALPLPLVFGGMVGSVGLITAVTRLKCKLVKSSTIQNGLPLLIQLKLNKVRDTTECVQSNQLEV
jgi:hypothetical protein